MFQKKILFIFILLTAGMLTACGQESNTNNKETEIYENTSEEAKTEDEADNRAEMPSVSEKETEEVTKAEDMKEKFGENCIAEQTFEVELSEYEGTVYFVPFATVGEEQEFSMQIIQDDKVLADIYPYVPGELEGETFTSLDAVSFYDVNYDNNTDIILIETYGNTSFAAVYYGFAADAEDYERYFISQEQLSETITNQVEQLTLPEIRNFLTDGKKNGDFESFQEAYEAVSRFCQVESNGEYEYNLIYFDEDDIPELVAGKNGYYTSLYTYDNGRVYTLMDCWPYGAGGNAGYEYVPGKNTLRNYNSDYAGAILYTTYMTIGNQHTMETVVQIETYNFDDVNKNGDLDENEIDSVGYYGVSYINGEEMSEEEEKKWNHYYEGQYENIEVNMNFNDLQSKLKNP